MDKEQKTIERFREWITDNVQSFDPVNGFDQDADTYAITKLIVDSYSQEIDAGILSSTDLSRSDFELVITPSSCLKWKPSTILRKVEGSNLQDSHKQAISDAYRAAFESSEEIGFFTNSGYPHVTDESAAEFIILLCEINKLSSLTDSSSEVIVKSRQLQGSSDIDGVGDGYMSQVLHALKPGIFPIINNASHFDMIVSLKGSFWDKVQAIDGMRQKYSWWPSNYRIFDCFGWGLEEECSEGVKAETSGCPFDKRKLSRIIQCYKNRFSEIRGDIETDDGEGFRWRAIKHFSDNWDFEAPDFSEMVERSLMNDDVDFLVRGYAKGFGDVLATLKVLVEYEPETFRKLFDALAHDAKSLLARIKDFRSGCKGVFERLRKDDPSFEKKQHLQSARAVSVYAFLLDPDAAFIYRGEDCGQFESMIGFSSKSKQGQAAQAEFFGLAEQVCEILQKDEELCALSDSSSSAYFADIKRHALTDEIIYFATNYMEDGEMETRKNNYSKNIILYGPPGTGKTYNVAALAKAIHDGKDPLAIDFSAISDAERKVAKKWYDRELKDPSGHVAFSTFHQSYSYEDFIEGIRPVLDEDDDGDADETRQGLHYRLEDGVFKAFCERADAPILVEDSTLLSGLNANPAIWKVSLNGTGDNPVRSECLQNGHIRIGWDSYGPEITDETEYSSESESGGKNVLTAFISKMRVGDFVVSCFSSTTVDAIGIVTGEYQWDESFDDFKRVRTVNWVWTSENDEDKYDIVDSFGVPTMTLATVYRSKLTRANILAILEEKNPGVQSKENDEQYIFVVDEINRGNISKIFGELITLVEDSKRKGCDDEQWAVLPYSKKPFSIPQNVTILGTMNTADRSIALMDTALRRRFDFIEMMPMTNLLKGVIVDGVSVAAMLSAINERIEVLVDREHTIGHASFMKLAQMENPGIEDLARIFSRKVMPLLQEYFYDDYAKIRMVLGDAFIKESKVDVSLLDKYGEQIEQLSRFEIREEAFLSPDAYKAIYAKEDE